MGRIIILSGISLLWLGIFLFLCNCSSFRPLDFVWLGIFWCCFRKWKTKCLGQICQCRKLRDGAGICRQGNRILFHPKLQFYAFKSVQKWFMRDVTTRRSAETNATSDRKWVEWLKSCPGNSTCSFSPVMSCHVSFAQWTDSRGSTLLITPRTSAQRLLGTFQPTAWGLLCGISTKRMKASLLYLNATRRRHTSLTKKSPQKTPCGRCLKLDKSFVL